MVPFLSGLQSFQNSPRQSYIIEMRFLSALFVLLSVSFAVAVPFSSETEAAAELFNDAYSEKCPPEEDAAAAEWFNNAYEGN